MIDTFSAGVITDSQANQILTLIDNSSREIQLIFKQYEQHKDVHTLINSLRMASSEAEEVDEDNEGEQNSEENEDEDFDSTARVGGEIDEDDSELDEVIFSLFYLNRIRTKRRVLK